MTLPIILGITWHGDEPLPEKTEYLIEKLLPMTGVGLLVGEPKVGKTFLTIGMAVAIASGSWFLGRCLCASTDEPWHARRIVSGGTLIWAGEGLATYPPRLAAAVQGLSEPYRARLDELESGRLPVTAVFASGLRDDGVFEYFYKQACEIAECMQALNEYGLRLIVVDTLPSVFGFHDENSAAEANNAISKLVRLSRGTGAFVLATGHPAKHASKDKVRGSGAFEGAVDLILSAKQRGRSGTRVLSIAKARGLPDQEHGWEYRLVPIELPNGETCAYVDGTERTPNPAPLVPVQERGRLTQDAKDVLDAIRSALQSNAVTWSPQDGAPVLAVTEEAVRSALAYLKRPASPDPKKRDDAIRKSYRRGIERLELHGLIDQGFDGRARRPLFWLTEKGRRSGNDDNPSSVRGDNFANETGGAADEAEGGVTARA